MFLYLVQHAEAKREEEDPARDLTAKGLQDINRVANHVGKLGLAVSQIFHSGKTRAQSTANVLAAALQPAQGVLQATGLGPLDDPAIWASRISQLNDHVILVGHLPHLAKLAAQLLTGESQKTVLNFKMGGMACLRRSPEGSWLVEWMLIPDLIP